MTAKEEQRWLSRNSRRSDEALGLRHVGVSAKEVRARGLAIAQDKTAVSVRRGLPPGDGTPGERGTERPPDRRQKNPSRACPAAHVPEKCPSDQQWLGAVSCAGRPPATRLRKGKQRPADQVSSIVAEKVEVKRVILPNPLELYQTPANLRRKAPSGVIVGGWFRGVSTHVTSGKYGTGNVRQKDPGGGRPAAVPTPGAST